MVEEPGVFEPAEESEVGDDGEGHDGVATGGGGPPACVHGESQPEAMIEGDGEEQPDERGGRTPGVKEQAGDEEQRVLGAAGQQPGEREDDRQKEEQKQGGTEDHVVVGSGGERSVDRSEVVKGPVVGKGKGSQEGIFLGGVGGNHQGTKERWS